ncbi:ZPR1 zinc finger domain-containing protein [archaeon]|jgi:zinc finger protein|nr:ZPR1 zinc finger domain-containing protein [archaeon]MBT4397311.1 ZPR1 zinc finger domain-containing protein [archaeon]MBT4440691.1 ZPR1 zinc finger domain-containing protein [archaeon]
MVDEINGELCPFCNKKTLTLREEEIDVPHFGKTFVFSMTCSECNFNKSDVEAAERKDPVKITFNIEKEEDMKVRIVKSSEASIKVPGLKIDVRPGPASIGFVSNIEGVLDKFQGIIEGQRDSTDDAAIKKKAKNLLKKLRKVKWGDQALKLIIEDPSGNSAIVSERAEIKKLK